MRVLVTGTEGFIASHLCEALLARGDSVRGCGLGRQLANLAACLDHPAFEYEQLDLAQRVPDLAGVDSVVHLAALAGTAQSWGAFPAYVSANILATDRLLGAVAIRRVPRFVYVSSSSVYGNVDGRPSALRPLSPYGVTKLAAEQLVNVYAGRGDLKTLFFTVRPFSVYGPRQRPDMFVHIAIDRLLRGQPVPLEGEGKARRTFTYIADMVEALLAALDRPDLPQGAAVDVSGKEQVTVKTVIDWVAAFLELKPRIEHRPRRVGDQAVAVADLRPAAKLLGWQPKTPFVKGLHMQIEWQRRQLRQGTPCTT